MTHTRLTQLCMPMGFMKLCAVCREIMERLELLAQENELLSQQQNELESEISRLTG